MNAIYLALYYNFTLLVIIELSIDIFTLQGKTLKLYKNVQYNLPGKYRITSSR